MNLQLSLTVPFKSIEPDSAGADGAVEDAVSSYIPAEATKCFWTSSHPEMEGGQKGNRWKEKKTEAFENEVAENK